MSAAATVIELPIQGAELAGDDLVHGVVLALAAADDLASAMDRVVALVYRSSGANRIEWWTTGDDGTARLGAAIGIARGQRRVVPLGRAGEIALFGGDVAPEVASALATA